jgi:hypothetical protein
VVCEAVEVFDYGVNRVLMRNEDGTVWSVSFDFHVEELIYVSKLFNAVDVAEVRNEFLGQRKGCGCYRHVVDDQCNHEVFSWANALKVYAAVGLASCQSELRDESVVEIFVPTVAGLLKTVNALRDREWQ